MHTNVEAVESRWQEIPFGGNCKDLIKADIGRRERGNERRELKMRERESKKHLKK